MRDTSRHFPARTTLLAAALTAGVFAAASSAALHHAQPPGPAGAPVVAAQDRRVDPGEWPAVTREAKPWSRWWWHGSAVDPASLTAQLEALRDAGIGGVEITPIYGVRGGETQFIPYLSERVGAHARAHVARGESTRPRRRHGHRDRLAVRRAVGRRRRQHARARAQDVDARAGREAHRAGAAAPGPAPESRRHRPSPGSPRGSRPVQIADLVEPVTANPDLQALALDQVRYPRDLPLLVLMAYSDAGAAIDLTQRVRPDGTLDWDRAGRAVDAARRCFSAGTARWSSAPRPAAKGRSSITSRGARSGNISRGSIGRSPDTAPSAFARSSTTRTKWTMRADREMGRRRCSTNSSGGAATTSDATCRRSSAGTTTIGARVCSPITARRSRTCSSIRSRPNGARGRADVRLWCATRRTDRRPASSTSMRRATSRRPKGTTCHGSSGRRRPGMWQGGAWCRRRPRRGSASTSARRSPTCARPSTASSSPASTTSCITARPTRPRANPGRDGCSTRRSSSTRRTPGGTTSAR